MSLVKAIPILTGTVLCEDCAIRAVAGMTVKCKYPDTDNCVVVFKFYGTKEQSHPE